MKFSTGLIGQWFKSWYVFSIQLIFTPEEDTTTAEPKVALPKATLSLPISSSVFSLSSHVAIIYFIVITWEHTCITQWLSNFTHQNEAFVNVEVPHFQP